MKMLKTKYSKIAVITLMACSVISASSYANKTNYQAMPSKIAQNQLIKSINNSKTYDCFTLGNGMEVIVASDPTLTQAAVSLSVGVGQLQDPELQQGLIHYLEHMIFTWSTKFRQPS